MKERNMQHVWIFGVEATGPEDSDFDGIQSVHATRKSAELALFDFVAGLGVDPRNPEATTAATQTHTDDQGEVWQICGEVETTNGWSAVYSIRRAEVRP
jgi:hypothetical protein